MDVLKKKRGRKPKNFTFDEVPIQAEKKKRGRKKKYEIENFERILNRNEENNFNHNVMYSDDETAEEKTPNCVKKISFGNLDITVSKKVETENVDHFKFKTRTNFESLIDENEYSSEEEKEIPVESFVKINEKVYSETKKYAPKIMSECKIENSLKRIKVVTTTKDQIKESNYWPESCNCCCWWCCHTFEGSPCTLPTKYDPIRKRFLFVGLFCSWNCVKAYNFDKSDNRMAIRTSLITLLIQQLHGVTESICIKPAPPRQTLKMFGGYLDINQFRTPREIDSYQINILKFNYVYPEISEIKNVKINQEKKNLRLSRPI